MDCLEAPLSPDSSHLSSRNIPSLRSRREKAGLRTTFGLVPLYGHDVWLHAVLAAVAAYFGFVARADTGEPVRT